MFKEYLLLMLLGHILADFYTQTYSIAEKKREKLEWVFIHCFMYFLTVTIVSIPVISFKILLLDAVASLCHAIIDIMKYIYLKNRKKENATVFIVDQCLHLICIVVIAYIWTNNKIRLRELKLVLDFFDTANISEILACKWFLGLLLIYKPANILIQNLIGLYKPKTNNHEIKSDNNTGRKIGTIERLIMFILLYLNQYSAIGLVLTAKSIARYDQITKDEKFAEYYLLGTLISVGITVVCAVLLF